MMGKRSAPQGELFYECSLETHVPLDHLLRSIDRFVDVDDIRRHLAQFYSSYGRPSIDPELMIRMLLVGYCFGIRSERRLCEAVHLKLACRLGLTDRVPDHSTFSKNRHGRFRDSDLFRHLFEDVQKRRIAEGLVSERLLAPTLPSSGPTPAAIAGSISANGRLRISPVVRRRNISKPSMTALS